MIVNKCSLCGRGVSRFGNQDYCLEHKNWLRRTVFRVIKWAAPWGLGGGNR